MVVHSSTGPIPDAQSMNGAWRVAAVNGAWRVAAGLRGCRSAPVIDPLLTEPAQLVSKIVETS